MSFCFCPKSLPTSESPTFFSISARFSLSVQRLLFGNPNKIDRVGWCLCSPVQNCRPLKRQGFCCYVGLPSELSQIASMFPFFCSKSPECSKAADWPPGNGCLPSVLRLSISKGIKISKIHQCSLMAVCLCQTSKVLKKKVCNLEGCQLVSVTAS